MHRLASVHIKDLLDSLNRGLVWLSAPARHRRARTSGIELRARRPGMGGRSWRRCAGDESALMTSHDESALDVPCDESALGHAAHWCVNYLVLLRNELGNAMCRTTVGVDRLAVSIAKGDLLWLDQ